MKNMSQSTDPQFPPHENTPLITTAQPGSAYLLESITGEEISSNLKPLDKINGYDAVSYTHLTLPTILLV